MPTGRGICNWRSHRENFPAKEDRLAVGSAVLPRALRLQKTDKIMNSKKYKYGRFKEEIDSFGFPIPAAHNCQPIYTIL